MNRIFFLASSFPFFFLASIFYSCSDGTPGKYKKDDEITICENGNLCINGIDTEISPKSQGSVVERGEDGYWYVDGERITAVVNDQECSLIPDASSNKVTITCDEEENPEPISINSCNVEENASYILVKCGEQVAQWAKDPALDPTADVEMLGLVPGATTSELNLTWWSTLPSGKNCSGSSGDHLKPFVRLINEDGDIDIIELGVNDSRKVNFGNVALKDRINIGDEKCYHQVTLTSLEAGKKYTYSVSSDGEEIDINGVKHEWNRKWSREYEYKVPASTGAFKFAAVGDPQLTAANIGHETGDNRGKQDPYSKYSSQTTANGWKETVKKIKEAGAQFIVSVGDQVDKASYSEYEYQNFFAPPELRSIPLAPTMGNHDVHCIYYSHYNIPNLSGSPYNISECEPTNGKDPVITDPGKGNYYYRYNNILFVVLNTAPSPTSKDDATRYVNEFAAFIETAKADGSDYDWLIVQHHKSTKSVANHASDLDLLYYVQAGLEKTMTDKGVDLVLSGHDHIYVRSHLMKWDANAALTDVNAPKGYSVKSTDNTGTLYLTLTTASGLKYYPMYAGMACTEQQCGYSNYIPVLNDLTAGRDQLRSNYGGSTNASIFLSASEINPDKLPLSMFLVDQKLVPSYTMFDVNGLTMRVTTRGIDGSYIDAFTITKSGSSLTIK